MRQHHHVFLKTPWIGKCSGDRGICMLGPAMHGPQTSNELYKDTKWHKAHPKSLHHPRPPCQEANCPPCNRSMLTVCASLQYLYFEVQCQRSLTAQHIYSTYAISLPAVHHKKVDGTGTHQTPRGAFCQAILMFQAVPAAAQDMAPSTGHQTGQHCQTEPAGPGGLGQHPIHLHR